MALFLLSSCQNSANQQPCWCGTAIAGPGIPVHVMLEAYRSCFWKRWPQVSCYMLANVKQSVLHANCEQLDFNMFAIRACQSSSAAAGSLDHHSPATPSDLPSRLQSGWFCKFSVCICMAAWSTWCHEIRHKTGRMSLNPFTQIHPTQAADRGL